MDKKIIIPREVYIPLYGTLSEYVLVKSSLDPIFEEDENGNETIREEKQDEYIDIVNDIENILSDFGIHPEPL
mgnify:FL=1|tara:strand:+ start:3200 stop:3418 length:219 start_codon:yes stop_codon:yes gene_type:complete